MLFWLLCIAPWAHTPEGGSPAAASGGAPGPAGYLLDGKDLCLADGFTLYCEVPAALL